MNQKGFHPDEPFGEASSAAPLSGWAPWFKGHAQPKAMWGASYLIHLRRPYEAPERGSFRWRKAPNRKERKV